MIYTHAHSRVSRSRCFPLRLSTGCSQCAVDIQTVAKMPHFGLAHGTLISCALLLAAAVDGARSRNRTGMLLPARDFKSLVSTYFTIRAAAEFSYAALLLLTLASPTGFEPVAYSLEGCCSILLS